MSRIPARALAAALAILVATPSLFAEVEDDLQARLRGRLGLLLSPVSTECTDHYTDNEVAGRFASGAGPVRLDAGELVSIDNVSVNWHRLDVNLGLQVPYRVTIVDGPFTLYELRSCRAQLKFEVPGEVRRDRSRAEAVIRELLEVHDSLAEARSSTSWNWREPELLPEDSEAAWAEYRSWKAEQVNAAIRERLAAVLEEARRAVRSMDDDPDYLDSFARGVESKRYESSASCDALLSASFYRSGSGGSSSRGWTDGQRLGWAVAIARGLQDCWVEVPPAR